MGVCLSRSRNKMISYWIKESNYLAFFQTQICANCYSRTLFFLFRTLFAGLNLVSYKNYLLDLFFQQWIFLIQKLYFFKLVKFNLIFYFLSLIQALTLCLPGKIQHPTNVLIPIFDYQFIFKKYKMY